MADKELKSIKFPGDDTRYVIPKGVSSPTATGNFKQVGQVRDNNGKLEYTTDNGQTWIPVGGGGGDCIKLMHETSKDIHSYKPSKEGVYCVQIQDPINGPENARGKNLLYVEGTDSDYIYTLVSGTSRYVETARYIGPELHYGPWFKLPVSNLLMYGEMQAQIADKVIRRSGSSSDMPMIPTKELQEYNGINFGENPIPLNNGQYLFIPEVVPCRFYSTYHTSANALTMNADFQILKACAVLVEVETRESNATVTITLFSDTGMAEADIKQGSYSIELFKFCL